MKRMTVVAGLAGLLLTLTGAAEPAQRFRWLGVGSRLAMLASDDGGPRSARLITLVAATVGERGPNGSDSFVFTISNDCEGRMVQLIAAKAYSNDEELPVGGAIPQPRKVDPDSAFEAGFNFACSGIAPDGEPVWIEGIDKARAFAIDRANEGTETDK